jgi:hypothetical protein
MYYAIVAAFMVILPIASILIEMTISPATGLVILIGKWFVFWAVGMRLLTAGTRQLLQPEYTAKTIFEIEDPGAQKVVRELGISNITIGVLGVVSIYFPGLVMPSALYGFLFFGLAGVCHVANEAGNRIATVAAISDLWVAAVCAFYLASCFI